DQALFDYTKQFDGVQLDRLRVSEAEIDEAFRLVDDDFIQTLQQAKDNIETYHKEQRQNSWIRPFRKDVRLGQQINSIDRVGL
ncbi:MAG TPA: histidinol dehydrogenase, partial [Eubacteriaceae bacterium]|nr:histidinol dehydrogenase [Eubacteriaceae bacterium]